MSEISQRESLKSRSTSSGKDGQDKKSNKMESTYPTEHPLCKFKTYLIEDALGGPKLLKLNWVVNTAKGLTPFFIVAMMNFYQNFSLGSYIYLVLHGSYGIIWLAKDLLFPDKSFQVRQTIAGSIAAVTCLLGYWSIGWQILSGRGEQNPSMSLITACSMLYIFGVSLMLVADAQKFYTLKYRSGLINEGLFARCRNPNYLGEMCLYSSFALLTKVWESWIPLIFMWSFLFAINMYLKDISLSRKAGGKEYLQQSYLLIFKVFNSDIANIILYTVFALFLYRDYQVGGFISTLKKN